MLLILIKLIVTVAAFVSITKSYLDYRKQREPLVMFVFWAVVWVVATVVINFPYLIDQVLAYSRDESVTIGSIISASFVFVLFIVYRVYLKVARIEYQQAELIRKLGLKREFKKNAPR